eukprot:TRINITY_DN900_c0_g1_i2.p1 TRINITY_DN900_c0_g1~~TRINITY_DN900_c0_g1_i2.p1  ORF type:complete len:224 (-),score=43.76 TRINITY_DN900_c0_g1_i2:360-1031(-)
MGGELLSIQPGELKFTFELRKQVSSSLRLVNVTSDPVAFKVKTTAPKQYCVRPNTGIIPPSSSFEVTVTMQAQKEAPPDMQCKDKFLVQSVIVPEGVATPDQDLFNKESGREVHDAKLRVVYVAPQPTDSVSEANGISGDALADAPVKSDTLVSKSLDGKLALELEEARKENFRLKSIAGSQKLQSAQSAGWSTIVLVLSALLFLIIGYFLGQTPLPAPKSSA